MVDTGHVAVGVGGIWPPVCLRVGLRPDLKKGRDMAILTWITAAVTVLLLIYLFAALVRPEWF
jgi:K+-transporting ATPase KdpF subunit